MNTGFLPLARADATARLAGAFFTMAFVLGRAFLTLDFLFGDDAVAIEISFARSSRTLIETLKGTYSPDILDYAR
jgi:hypothetical protein